MEKDNLKLLIITSSMVSMGLLDSLKPVWPQLLVGEMGRTPRARHPGRWVLESSRLAEISSDATLTCEDRVRRRPSLADLEGSDLLSATEGIQVTSEEGIPPVTSNL